MENKYGKLALAAGCILLMASCGNKAKISGRFIGYDEKPVYLELVAPVDNKVVDSVMTDSKGNYKFKVDLPSQEAMLYNIRVDNDFYTIFLAPGQNVKLSSLYGNTRNYEVTGSPESELLRRLNEILQGGAARLDSIASARSLYEPSDEDRREAMTEYVREYHSIKREHVRFIVENNGSLAALYGLYQRLPNDEVLFNGETDIIYYRMVADSVAVKYPKSPYLASLRSAIDSYDKGEELLRSINEKLENPISYPDIEMQDMYGVKHRLSDNDGKVILLDFWAAAAENSAIHNAELKGLYSQYSQQGFVIYQVSLDDSKPVWVNAVQAQKLPWISVCDFKGAASPAARAYLVQEIPYNLLIDAEGNVTGKNLSVGDMEKQLPGLLKNVRL